MNRLLRIRVAGLTALFAVLSLRDASAHHQAILGSEFWHQLVHMLGSGVPLLLLGTATILVMWYKAKAER